MTDTQIRFQQTFDELSTISRPDKILFLDLLLSSFIVPARGIWSDDKPSDKDKVEALKWLNELTHRIWNIRFELNGGVDSDSIVRLYENLKFYGEQSALLQTHLGPTYLHAIELFKKSVKKT